MPFSPSEYAQHALDALLDHAAIDAMISWGGTLADHQAAIERERTRIKSGGYPTQIDWSPRGHAPGVWPYGD